MRSRLVLKEVVSLALAVLFVGLLSVPIGPLPPFGGLLNPNGGVWTAAEDATHPPAEEVRVPGLDGDVTVLRDAWGVPHVFASTDRDLFFALGYLHAQDRLWQMDIQHRFAAGRLSEVLGDDFVEQDSFLRTIGLARDARAYYGNLPAGEDRDALEAYAAGVNAFIQRAGARNVPLEFKLLNYAPEPWTPVHSLTLGALVAFGLSGDFVDVELGVLSDGLEPLYPGAIDELFPADSPLQVPIIPGTRGGGPAVHPDAARDLLRKAAMVEPYLRPLRAMGSNNWVVSGRFTDTGKPILAGDPHLQFQLPAVWYEVQLKGGSYDVYGVTFPGLPPVFIGFNRFVAWSETNTGADVTDFYRESVNPSNPDEYRFRGQWRPFTVHREVVRVRGGADVVVDVKESLHGPLVTEEGESLAMRWTGREFGPGLLAALNFMRARTWTEFREALRDWKNPAQNFAFAARACEPAWTSPCPGRIAIRSNGLFPIRNNTFGRVPLDGASGDFEWTGWVPFDEYPEAVDPSQGYLSSTNQLPAGQPYPHYLGWLWDPGYRSRRINVLLNDTIARQGVVSLEDLRSFQLDTVDTAAQAFVPFLLNATSPCIAALCPAWELLAAWDHGMDVDEVAATVWRTFYWDFLDEVFGDEWAEANVTGRMMPFPNVVENLTRTAPGSPWFDDVRSPAIVEQRDDILGRALRRTVDDLTARLGPMGPAWEWGRVHSRFFGHLSGLDALSRGPYPSPGDEVTLSPAAGDVSRGGPSWRMVADLSDPSRSVTVYPGGQSGNPLSPHYDDQLRLWLAGEHKAIEFPSTPILARPESTLVLRRA